MCFGEIVHDSVWFVDGLTKHREDMRDITKVTLGGEAGTGSGRGISWLFNS